VGLAAALGAAPGHALDLGTGGGVPGLILALWWPDSEWTLLDANRRRTTWLQQVVLELGLAPRVSVVRARAEVAGRDRDHRSAYDLVTARSFGPPAVTAECGAPFLRVGGALLVAEPPLGGDRWPREPLNALGLQVATRQANPAAIVLHQVSGCPDRYPRGVGVPGKRPLF